MIYLYWSSLLIFGSAWFSQPLLQPLTYSGKGCGSARSAIFSIRWLIFSNNFVSEHLIKCFITLYTLIGVCFVQLQFLYFIIELYLVLQLVNVFIEKLPYLFVSHVFKWVLTKKNLGKVLQILIYNLCSFLPFL